MAGSRDSRAQKAHPHLAREQFESVPPYIWPTDMACAGFKCCGPQEDPEVQVHIYPLPSPQNTYTYTNIHRYEALEGKSILTI